jgi:hypothetical protein
MPHPQFIANQSVASASQVEPARMAGATPRADLLATVQPAVQAIRTNPEAEWTVESLAEIERALDGLRKKGCVVDPIELNVVE